MHRLLKNIVYFYSVLWLIHDFGDLSRRNLSGLQNPTGFPPKSWMSPFYLNYSLTKVFTMRIEPSESAIRT